MLKEFRKGVSVGEFQIRRLPGAQGLLEWLTQQTDICFGIVTGNHQEIARLKFTYTGIDPDWFTVWVRGDLSANRSDLVPITQRQAETNHN